MYYIIKINNNFKTLRIKDKDMHYRVYTIVHLLSSSKRRDKVAPPLTSLHITVAIGIFSELRLGLLSFWLILQMY